MLPTGVPQQRWHIAGLSYSMAGLVALFGWLLLGDFAWSLKERAVTPVAQILLKQLQASDFYIALIVGSLPAALGMLLAPVVAVRSDRHRGRWGRRLPFLLVPTPVVVLGLVGMAFTPQLGQALHELLGTRSPGLRLCTLGLFTLMWTAFEVASVTANAVFGGLINDVVPQALIGRFYGFFRATSLIAGMFFTYQVLGQAEAYFKWVFLGIAAAYGLGFTLMCLRVREPLLAAPEAREDGDGAGGGWRGGVARYLRECFSRPYYVWLFVAMMLGLVAASPVNTFGLFYAREIGLGLDAYGKFLALTYLISLLLAVPVGWLADRLHPLRVGFGAIVLYALAMAGAGSWIDGERSFAIAFVAHGVLSGIYLTGSAALGQYLFPRSRFAQFQSAMQLLAALGYMLVSPVMGAVLDASGANYRYTFIGSALLAAASALAYAQVYRRFVQLGGVARYQAPE